MKKFLNIFISIIIFILLSILVFSYSTKKIVVNMISNSFTGSEVSGKILDYIYDEIPELSVDELGRVQDEIRNNPVINTITNKYLDGIINSILKDKTEKVDISKEMTQLVDSINISVPEYNNELKNKISNIDFNTAYESVLYESKNEMSPKLETFLNIYNIIENKTFILITSILLLINVLVLFIINKSILDTIKLLSIISVVFGFMGSVIIFLIKKNMYYITNKLLGRTTNIELNIPANISLACVVIGSLLIIFIYLLKKKKSKI